MSLSVDWQKKFLTKIHQDLAINIKKYSGKEKKDIRDEIIIITVIVSNLENWKYLFNGCNEKQIEFFNKKYGIVSNFV